MRGLIGFIAGALVISAIGIGFYAYQDHYDDTHVTSVSDGISDVAEQVQESTD